MRNAAIAAVLLFAVSASPSIAVAEGGNVAAAEALFREARALMKAGDFESACPKFAESQRLDPGVGTLANLALCYERLGKLASAWGKYREAAGEAKRQGQRKRARQAAKKAEQLEPKLHRLAIMVPKKNRIDGLVVKRAGVEIGEGSFGSEVPVDLGDIEVTASAPGHKTFTKTITLKPGRKRRVVEIPRLKRKKVVAVRDRDGVRDSEVSVSRGNRPDWYADPIAWGLVGGGVALALGGGLWALPKSSDLDKQALAADDLPDFESKSKQSDQFKAVGIGMLAVGGTLVVAGVIKLVMRPNAEAGPAERGFASAQPVVGRQSAGVRFRF